jgi:uncharacterized protein with NRDE domain
MCLLVVLSRVVPGFPLIVAANRDERLDRPADAMTVLRASRPRTIGGRDALAGGTWLAVNEFGLVAGLTNRPNPAGRDPAKRSRGELPLALTAHPTVDVAVDAFVTSHQPADYNAAWLLVGDRVSLVAIDMTDEPVPVAVELAPGIHVLENRAYGMPSIKVAHVRELLAGIDQVPAAAVEDRLWAVLADHEIPPDEPDAAEAPERPAAVNAACVHTEGYGTRWSALVLVADDPAAPPAFTYTDGPPCTATRVDAASFWSASG